MKIYVNHYGWVMGVNRTDGAVTGLRFTKVKAGAKPFAGDWIGDKETDSVLYYIENTMRCAYDKVS